jgi:hypothetical protein
MLRIWALPLTAFAVTSTPDGIHTFSNPESIWISDAPDPYPSIIDVEGVGGRVAAVEVCIKGLSHQRPEDIDMLLVSPDGTAVMLMSDVGGDTLALDVEVTFDEDAPSIPPDQELSDGIYSPTNEPPYEVLPSPAPEGPYGTRLSEFEGAEANGEWRLYIYDDMWKEYGSASEWSITLTMVPEPQRK